MSFLDSGLRFSCARCSGCCRHEGGYVFLSEKDLYRLAEATGMTPEAFVGEWCRWVPYVPGSERLSLREKPDMDCILWSAETRGCSFYEARPLQCVAFPFWDSVVGSPEAWARMARECPGMDSGEPRSGGEIGRIMRDLGDAPVIERRIPREGCL